MERERKKKKFFSRVVLVLLMWASRAGPIMITPIMITPLFLNPVNLVVTMLQDSKLYIF